MALYIVKPWYKKQAAPAPIYGAEWAGTSDPSWTRTDDAASFADPDPYYSGMSGTPSSPFDNILPWSGLRRVTDNAAGELVEIPKYYYKWTRDGDKMKLQISMDAFDGSHVSPAHADRGDGVGERDYVYIGRYHSADDYMSKSGVYPKVSTTRAAFRTGIHNLGTYIWQNDFAIYWTVAMLYLVEYADWDSQAKLGWGCGNNSSVERTGSADNMPYHTGTMQTSRNMYGVGVQYRYITDLYECITQLIDGIYFNSYDVYCIKNPANFSDTAGGTLVGTRAQISNPIKYFNEPSVQGFEYALYPLVTDGTISENTYVTDYSGINALGRIVNQGSSYGQTRLNGLFSLSGSITTSESFPNVGSRLMVLPPGRLT